MMSDLSREVLGVDPLRLHMERSQLTWLGHLFRIPPGHLPLEVFLACPAMGAPEEDPGHAGVTMSLGWPGKALGSYQKSWRKCPGRGKSRCPCSGSCPRDPAPDNTEDGWIDYINWKERLCSSYITLGLNDMDKISYLYKLAVN